MKKKLLFSLIFMILFLIIFLQVVIAGEYYCFIFEWTAPGGIGVYRSVEHDTSSAGSHSIPDSDGYSPYRCDPQGQYKIKVTHYYYPSYLNQKACETYGGSFEINTHYVDWDLYRDDCDCYSGGDGAVCSFGESICWTSSNPTEASGNHCCGDDGAETYEDGGTGRSCCYNGQALPHNNEGDGIQIPDNLLCYNGEFYSCNRYYDFASYNEGDCFTIGGTSGHYCHPAGNYWASGTGEGVSCGDCRECAAGECNDLCVPCQDCITGDVCVWYGSGTEDPRCGIDGIIDCGGWYSATGREGPDDDDLQQCWSYVDITSGQCKEGGCKEANSSDCETWSYPDIIPEYECGECEKIEDGDCYQDVLGGCTDYLDGTPCRVGVYGGLCDGAGTCEIVTECADGTPVGECSTNQPEYCSLYGILYDECETCYCPSGLDCTFSGHCVDPDFDCSTVPSEGECNNNAPTCFWDGTACSSCTTITSCDSYTSYNGGVCEADMCGITQVSSNCSWDVAIGCFENIFTEDCSNGIDDDGDWLADCDDPDCSSTAYCQGSVSCGDGIINSGEECDTGIFSYGWDSCEDFGYGGGILACNPPGAPGSCRLDFSGCTDPVDDSPFCGNDIIESGESCDGTELGGVGCGDLGFFSGSLACINCHFDTSYCAGAVTKESNIKSCDNEIDDDDDDYVDYLDADCQDPYKTPNPKINRTGGHCGSEDKTATATITYEYYLRFDLGTKTITKDVEVTCPVPIGSRLSFFSLLSFLITAVLLFAYYLLRGKKVFNRWRLKEIDRRIRNYLGIGLK